MAPEVYRHEVYNETADVFSFGVMIYQVGGGSGEALWSGGGQGGSVVWWGAGRLWSGGGRGGSVVWWGAGRLCGLVGGGEALWSGGGRGGVNIYNIPQELRFRFLIINI